MPGLNYFRLFHFFRFFQEKYEKKQPRCGFNHHSRNLDKSHDQRWWFYATLLGISEPLFCAGPFFFVNFPCSLCVDPYWRWSNPTSGGPLLTLIKFTSWWFNPHVHVGEDSEALLVAKIHEFLWSKKFTVSDLHRSKTSIFVGDN